MGYRHIHANTVKRYFTRPRRHYHHRQKDDTAKRIFWSVVIVIGVIVLYYRWQYIVGFLILIPLLGGSGKKKHK